MLSDVDIAMADVPGRTSGSTRRRSIWLAAGAVSALVGVVLASVFALGLLGRGSPSALPASPSAPAPSSSASSKACATLDPSPSAPAITPRSWAASAYDPLHGEVVVFGGAVYPAGQPRFLNDTWTWDGSRWSERHPKTSPPAMPETAGMAWDEQSQRIILVPAYMFPGQVPFDTWAWDGAEWTLLHPEHSPPGTGSPILVADPARKNVVLYASFPDNATWTWDGVDWHLASTDSPPNRRTPAIAYDGKTKKIVLFGGLGSPTDSGTRQTDTWTWDGKTWRQESPLLSPQASYGLAAAFDEPRNELILAGDTDRGIKDMWRWDGTTWIQLYPTARPSAGVGTAMVYDAKHCVLVLLGGSSSEPLQTWAWDGRSWRRLSAPPAPSPTPTPRTFEGDHQVVAAGFTCSLPVVVRPSMSDQPERGFIDFPSAAYRLDKQAPLEGETYLPEYRRWVPVRPDAVSPDGTRYAYAAPVSTDTSSIDALFDAKIHVVDLGTGEDTVVAGPGHWGVVSWGPEGLFLGQRVLPGGTAGLWLLNTKTGAIRQVVAGGRWFHAADGLAWSVGFDFANDRDNPMLGWMGQGASNEVMRLDLATGAIARVYFSSGHWVMITGFQGSGVAVVQAVSPSENVVSTVTKDGTVNEIYRSKEGFEVGRSHNFRGVSASADPHGLWLSWADGDVALVGADGKARTLAHLADAVVAGACA